jgi:hypothetical protein
MVYLTEPDDNSIVVNLYRFVIGFGYQMEVQGSLVYLRNLKNWEGAAAPLLLAIVIWIGDSLVASTLNRLESACVMRESFADIQVFPDLATELQSRRRSHSSIPQRYM